MTEEAETSSNQKKPRSGASPAINLKIERPDELRAGDLCPVCRAERLDYDGLLNLSCPVCGPAAVGCFT